MSDKKLDSGISLHGEKLKAVVEDPEEAEILGYGVMYTAGGDWKLMVPRDWLMRKVEELNIPRWVAPSAPRPSSAYKRALKRLREEGLNEISITAPRLDNQVKAPHPVRFHLNDGDSHKVKHLYAEVFFDEDECKEDEGKWIQHHLGYFDYDADSQSPVTYKDNGLSEEDLLYEQWRRVADGVDDMFEEMKTTHIGHDIRKMMYYSTRDYTESVIKLRDGGAVYFFPSGLIDFIDKMSELYDMIDEKWKVGGQAMAIRSFPIFESDSDWIEERVQQSLEDAVDDALDEAFSEFDEGETAEKTVRIIKENLSVDAETAERYNELLEAQLDIEEMLEEFKHSIDDEDKKDIIERAVSQADVQEF
ncbi:MAG: DUF6744 family protein [Halobacteria archaeon]